MRLLADENISPLLAASWKAAGHDVSLIAVIAPGATDEEVVDISVKDNRILVTEDKDFGELVFKRAHTVPGIIRLALPMLEPPLKVARILAALAELQDKALGQSSVVERTRIRSRQLPT